ncbi:APC family permease [Acidianus manzaensis]|uniref:Amino acid transporter n=1 Tax=Acidianus manzaensis TaxID=282676 RepID=A0A1W6JYN7_9CREN|nr:APC family permease [Acidianus manzaensis]ARM75355.1 amino acid transporter [Acidianus manzaensis]
MASKKLAPNVFLRQSSGLVRDVSPWPSLLATWALVTGGVPILILEWLWLGPGANWPLAYTMTLVPTLGMAFLFYLAGASMPRSGGDYVFNSRATHPALGFANYWALFIAFVLSQGYYSYLGASWLGYLFTGLGIYYHNSLFLSIGGFFGLKLGRILWGIIVGTIITSLIAIPVRFHWKFIAIAGAISVITTIVMFAALLMINPSSFSSSLASFTGIKDAYTEVISNASSNGLTFVGPFYGALLAIPAIWYYYTWYNLPASWAGEMKKVRFNVFLSIIVGVIMIAVYYILYTQVNIMAFGEKFLTSYSYIYCNGYSDPVVNSLSSLGTFTPFYALLVLGNPIIYILMFIAIWLPNYYSGPPLVLGLSRYLFSWSFDRIMPSWMADVDSRLNAPIKAILLIMALSGIGVVLYAYLPVLSLVDVTVAFEISYAIFAISAALMPYIRKDVYETTMIIKKKILGIPLVTLVGVPTFAFLVFATYITWGNPIILPINIPTILSLVGMYASGFIIYYAARAYNKRKGVEIDLAFKEIPPD